MNTRWPKSLSTLGATLAATRQYAGLFPGLWQPTDVSLVTQMPLPFLQHHVLWMSTKIIRPPLCVCSLSSCICKSIHSPHLAPKSVAFQNLRIRPVYSWRSSGPLPVQLKLNPLFYSLPVVSLFVLCALPQTISKFHKHRSSHTSSMWLNDGISDFWQFLQASRGLCSTQAQFESETNNFWLFLGVSRRTSCFIFIYQMKLYQLLASNILLWSICPLTLCNKFSSTYAC